MANVLPSVRGGTTQVLYPFTRRVRFKTMVCVHANGSEQRAATRGVPLFEGVLNYARLTKAERDSINSFFQNMGGQLLLWQMTVPQNGVQVTYQNLKFAQDVIEWREGPPGLYAATVNWRQVNNAGYTIPVPAASFPALASGAFCQLPYSPEWRQLTSVNDQPSGWAYAYKWYEANLTGFPSGSVRRWGLSNPSLSDADVVTIENYFVGNLGMWGQFTVTDPEDSTTHTARFANDALEIQYVGFHQTQVSFVLEETNG